MSFCRHCGRQIYEAQSFCAACGSSLGDGLRQQQIVAQPTSPSDGPVMQPRSDATLQKLRMLKSQTLPPRQNPGKKILIAVLAVFFVGAITAGAGVVYERSRPGLSVKTITGLTQGKFICQ